jgi:hypothetical protein
MGGEGQLGPLVPLESGFALLGDDRQIWRAGRWSDEAPLLAAVGRARVLDAVRDGARLLVLNEARVRAIAIGDGRVLAEAGPDRVTGGGFHPHRLGIAGPDRLLLVSTVQQAGVLALDDKLGFRWVDTFSFDTDRSVSLADSGVWLLTREGSLALAYQSRQLTEYLLASQ